MSRANDESPAEANDDLSAGGTTPTGGEPLVTVLRGAPTDTDVAALVAVLTAAVGATSPSGPHGPNDDWGRPTLLHRGAPAFTPYQFPDLSRIRD